MGTGLKGSGVVVPRLWSTGSMLVAHGLSCLKACGIGTHVSCIAKWNEVAQSYPTPCDPMDCSLPDSSVHGIFQARVLEWVTISFSRGSSQPRDWTRVSSTTGRRFTVWATREAALQSGFLTTGPPGKPHGFYILREWPFIMNFWLCFSKRRSFSSPIRCAPFCLSAGLPECLEITPDLR